MPDPTRMERERHVWKMAWLRGMDWADRNAGNRRPTPSDTELDEAYRRWRSEEDARRRAIEEAMYDRQYPFPFTNRRNS